MASERIRTLPVGMGVKSAGALLAARQMLELGYPLAVLGIDDPGVDLKGGVEIFPGKHDFDYENGFPVPVSALMASTCTPNSVATWADTWAFDIAAWALAAGYKASVAARPATADRTARDTHLLPGYRPVRPMGGEIFRCD